jgi:hypothetical protein
VTSKTAYLAGLLTLVRDGLAPIVDQLLAGDAPQDQLDELAAQFDQIARVLRHRVDVVMPVAELTNPHGNDIVEST